MKCEICKRNNAHPAMFVTLIDVNGAKKLNVCQPCLKKLKVASANPAEKTMEFYPVKGK